MLQGIIFILLSGRNGFFWDDKRKQNNCWCPVCGTCPLLAPPKTHLLILRLSLRNMAALLALQIFQKPGCVLFSLSFGFSHFLLALTFLAHYSGREFVFCYLTEIFDVCMQWKDLIILNSRGILIKHLLGGLLEFGLLLFWNIFLGLGWNLLILGQWGLILTGSYSFKAFCPYWKLFSPLLPCKFKGLLRLKTSGVSSGYFSLIIQSSAQS